MKPEWNKKYTTIAVYAFLVLCGVAAFVLSITHFSELKATFLEVIDIIAPLIGGVVIAYLLNPVLNFFERFVFKKIGAKKGKTKLRRGLSVLCSYLIIVLALTLFIILFVPNLVDSYYKLMDKYGSIDKINAAINSFISGNEFLAQNYDKLIELFSIEEGGLVDKIMNVVSSFIPSLITAITSFANGVYVAAISFIFSIYVLCYRETLTATIKKLATAVLNKKHLWVIRKAFKTTDDNIGKYVRGKLLGSLLVGIVSYIAYTVFGFEFAPVLAVIAGVTNMIPYFGPFIGGIPAGIIVFIAQPSKLILLIVIILVLQQLDGNILDPLIVGNNIGLAPVWTMMATIVFGGFFGIPGMFLGVPVFATIYVFVGEKVNSILKKKNLPIKTSDYLENTDEDKKDETNEPSPSKNDEKESHNP